MVKELTNDTLEASRERATIGPSITIKGEISGAEDLLIQGAVEGTVNLKDNTVVVGKSAKVNAHIYGKVIRVEGEVIGDLYGREQIVVHKTGFVRGNITAPRLSLEDGARLKGSIDTEPTSTEPTLTYNVEKIKAAATSASVEEPIARRNGAPAAAQKNSSTPVA